MNRIMKIRAFFIFLAAFVLVFASNTDSFAKKDKKTVIIALDKMDFRDLNYLMGDESAIGVMSAKTARGNGSSLESQYTTISTGIRVTVKEEDFYGIEKYGEGIQIKEFSEIKRGLDERYEGFTEKFKFSGDLFHQKGLKTAFLGNDSAAILLADSNGFIDYGDFFSSFDDYDFLRNSTLELLEKADLLAISYDAEASINRLEMIKNLIEEIDADVYLLPKYIGGNAAVINNTTIKPIMIKGMGRGILNSNTTKREALVTNIDIMPTILESYGIEYDGIVGKVLSVDDDSENLIEDLKAKFLRYTNLTRIKYSFNIMVIYTILIFILLYFIQKRNFENYDIFIYLPLTSILVSLYIGSFLADFHNKIYIFGTIAIAFILNFILKKLKILNLKYISLLIFTTIVVGIVIYPEIIYNSFVGYNNLISGGRFFGFNNDIMGTLIGSFLLSYIYLRENKERYKRQIITIIMVPILLISLSGRFGSNFGGLLTAIVLSSILIYFDFLENISFKKKLISATLVVLLIILGVIYMTKGSDNHIAEFAERVRLYGSEEFFYMVRRKFFQVINNAKRMPWYMALILQTTFLLNIIKDRKIESEIVKSVKLFLFIAFVALLTNDTGVVAFIYMNSFIIARILTRRDKESRTL
ncbi:MAG: hypothetical protein Q4P31_04630 [Andreesenia angusta]|nr:hypothetical protein [Andreesenia angusta]